MVKTDIQPYRHLEKFFQGAKTAVPEIVTRVATSNGDSPSCWGDPKETIDSLHDQGVSGPAIGAAVRAHLTVVYRRNGPKGWEIEQKLTRLLLADNKK